MTLWRSPIQARACYSRDQSACLEILVGIRIKASELSPEIQELHVLFTPLEFLFWSSSAILVICVTFGETSGRHQGDMSGDMSGDIRET